jgi:hypothetical protein
MSRASWSVIGIVTVILATAFGASALVVESRVTPETVRGGQDGFSVSAEEKTDGMVHFRIIYRLRGPRYLVARAEVREGQTVLMSSHTPTFVHENSAIFYLAISRKHLADSTFEVSERSFGDGGGQPVPFVGGTDHLIDLPAFAKEAAEKSD